MPRSKSVRSHRGTRLFVGPGERTCESRCIECLQIAYALAHADEMNGQFETVSECNEDASFRRTVQLRHDKPCQRYGGFKCLYLRDGVLSRGGVKHENGRM